MEDAAGLFRLALEAFSQEAVDQMLEHGGGGRDWVGEYVC